MPRPLGRPITAVGALSCAVPVTPTFAGGRIGLQRNPDRQPGGFSFTAAGPADHAAPTRLTAAGRVAHGPRCRGRGSRQVAARPAPAITLTGRQTALDRSVERQCQRRDRLPFGPAEPRKRNSAPTGLDQLGRIHAGRRWRDQPPAGRPCGTRTHNQWIKSPGQSVPDGGGRWGVVRNPQVKRQRVDTRSVGKCRVPVRPLTHRSRISTSSGEVLVPPSVVARWRGPRPGSRDPSGASRSGGNMKDSAKRDIRVIFEHEST
jgi:hypothetical protein